MKARVSTWRESLLATKLFAPPPRANRVARPRLTQAFDNAVRLGHKLVLIAAPAGFGKTTIVSDWLDLQNKKTPPVRPLQSWLTLDEGDNDSTRFLTYLLAALEPLAGETRAWDSLVQRLSDYPPPPPVAILTPVLNHLARTDPAPRLLVLDDYHAISAKEIHEALAFLIEHLPPNLHLVMTTRTDPPLPLARWRGRGGLTELRAGELSFTGSEAAEFLNETMRLQLDRAQIAALKARTEGWIAGLQLAGIALSADAPPEDRARFITAFTGTHRVVLDYLMEEVLHRQPPHLQKFLLESSLLERLSAPLCDALQGSSSDARSGGSSARLVLDELERNNLFLIPLDDSRDWYRFHPLWMDALRHRLRQSPLARVRALHLRASEWFESSGLIPEAVDHAFAADDIDRAARLVEAHAQPMLNKSEFAPLREWFARLPHSAYESRPRLCLDRAWWLLYTGAREQGDQILSLAERALDRPGWSPRETQLLRGEIETLRSAIVLERGESGAALEHAARAQALLDGADVPVRGTPELYGALAEFWSGRVLGVDAELAEASRRAQAVGNLYVAFAAACTRGEVLLMQGRAPEALTQLLELDAQTRELNIERRPYVALLHVNLGMVYYELNDRAACRAAFSRAVELSEFGGMPRPREWLIATAFLAWLDYLDGDRASAVALIARGEEHIKQYRLPAWAKTHLLDVGQCFGFWDNDAQEMRRWLDRNAVNVSDEPDYVNELTQMAIARMKMMHGESEPALQQIQRMTRAAQDAQRTGSLLRLYSLGAVLHEQLGQHGQALESLDRALDLGQAHGLVRAIIDEGETIRLLLLEKSREQHSPSRSLYIQRLLAEAERDLRATGSPLHPSSPTALPAQGASSAAPSPNVKPPPGIPPRAHGQALREPLSARELQVLQLIANGYSNREIAAVLVVGIGTVKTHVNNIFGKLQAANRTQAVRNAREAGLLE